MNCLKEKKTLLEWQKEILKYYENKENKNQRLGQWYINNFFKRGTTNPKLFYEKNDAKALAMIFHIINKESP
jgi:hypothetical protein